MKRFLFVFLSITVSVVLTIVGFEALLRFAHLWNIPDYGAMHWYQASSKPGLPYELKPKLLTQWGEGLIHTNSQGLRDTREFAREHPDTFRILAVGDSITFGFGVDQANTFPAELEKRINTSYPQGKKVEVLNAGVSGYSLMDESILLPYLLDQYKPDLVLWTLIPNDYDDSMGIKPDGLLSWEAGDTIVSTGSQPALGQDPGKPVNHLDFRQSMTTESLQWANNTVPPESQLHPWLQKHVYLYNFLSWSIRNIKQHHLARLNTQAATDPRWTAPDGSPWVLPRPSAVYSISSRRQSYNQELERWRQTLASQQLPMMVINTALPIDQNNRVDTPYYRYVEASAILGQSVYTFVQSHNLGWDGHWSASGNQIFSDQLARALICEKWLSGKAECESYTQLKTYSAPYWQTFSDLQRQFEAQYQTSIDFQTYRGFPQILGGVMAPRIFPHTPLQRAAFVLARPAAPSSVLRLKLDHLAPTGMQVSIKIVSQQRTLTHRAQLANTAPVVDLDLTEFLKDTAQDASPLEVHLRCEDTPCVSAKLIYLGFP